jgi:hypothetical protein
MLALTLTLSTIPSLALLASCAPPAPPFDPSASLHPYVRNFTFKAEQGYNILCWDECMTSWCGGGEKVAGKGANPYGRGWYVIRCAHESKPVLITVLVKCRVAGCVRRRSMGRLRIREIDDD